MALLDTSSTPGVEEDVYSRPLHRWLALLAAVLAWGFDGVEQGVYSIMTREALKHLVPAAREIAAQAALAGENAAAVARQMDAEVGRYFGLSIAMWLWGAAAGGVLFGRLGDRYGRVRGLLLSVTTYSIFTGLSALTTHWAPFMGCRFLGAMGLGGTWPLAVALVVETWPEQRRAVLAGAIGAAANVGYLIAATYSRLMIHYGASWRWIIGMGMLIGLLSLPVIFLVHEPTRWKRSRERRERSSLGELFSPTYRRSTIVGSLLSTVALLGTWGSFLWLATYVDQLTEGTPYAGNGKTIISQWQSVGQIAGGFLGGVLAGLLGNRRSYMLLCIGAYASVLTLLGLMTEFHVGYAALAALAGIFVTAFFGWLPKYLPELYPTRIRASGQGFSYNIGRVLAGIGVLGTGQLVQLFDGDYRRGMMVMASVYLLGVVVILFAPVTHGQLHEEDGAAGLPARDPA